MPKDMAAGKMTGLAEQRALAGTQEKKKREFITFEEEAGNSGGLQRCCEVMQRENQKGQSPTRI